MQIFPGDACCYDSLNAQGAETGVEHLLIESIRVFLVFTQLGLEKWRHAKK